MTESEEDFYTMCGSGGMSEGQDAHTPLDRAVSSGNLERIRAMCKKYGFARKRNLYYNYEIPALVQLRGSSRYRQIDTRKVFNDVLDILVQEGCDIYEPVRMNRHSYPSDGTKFKGLNEINIIAFVLWEWEDHATILIEALLERGVILDTEHMRVILSEDEIRSRIEQWPKLQEIIDEADYQGSCLALGSGAAGEGHDVWTPLDMAIYSRNLIKIRETCKKYGFSRKRHYRYYLDVPAVATLTANRIFGDEAKTNTRESFEQILDILVEEGCDLNEPVRRTRAIDEGFPEPIICTAFSEINIIAFILFEWEHDAPLLIEALLDRGVHIDKKQNEILLDPFDVTVRINDWPKLGSLL